MFQYYFDDLEAGSKVDIGPYLVTKEEIIAFAEEFDPAPFHLSEEAGKVSMMGGLCASGWHTCSMAMRMMCDSFLLHSSSQGAPGVHECKWMMPVKPGDTLSGHILVEGTRLSASRPGLGLVNFRCNVFNQNGEQVLTLTNTGMMKTRDAA